MLFQDVTIVNGMIRTKDSINDASLYEVKKNDEPNKEDLPYVVIEKKTGAKTYKATSEIDAYNWIKERTNDSIYDSYTYKGIEYERKDLWEKLKQEGKTKRFFTLSEKEKLGKDGQYIIYQTPDGCLYAVTRDTNDEEDYDDKEIYHLREFIRLNPNAPGNDKRKKQIEELRERSKWKAHQNDTADIKFNETPDSEFDKDELALGIKTEMEHTDNKEEAESIARDHLNEIPDYYTRLLKMEEEAKKEK